MFERVKSIGEQKDKLVAMLAGDVPDVAMGEQSHSPFECEFCAFCQPEDQPEYPVSLLPYI